MRYIAERLRKESIACTIADFDNRFDDCDSPRNNPDDTGEFGAGHDSRYTRKMNWQGPGSLFIF